MPQVFLCHICQRQDFDNNAATLALHYYQEHAAIYCCPYCNQQFVNAEDRDTHVNKRHASLASFCCIICDVRTRHKKEMTQHQKENHPAALLNLACGQCDNMVFIDKECFNLHKRYFPCDQKPPKTTAPAQRQRSASETRSPPSTSNAPNVRVSDQPSPRNIAMANLQGLCLSCFNRYPLGDLRHHLQQHSEQRDLISCNECFDLIRNPADFDKHAVCFELEARRFSTYMAFGSCKFSVCECKFCAIDQHQLSRHKGWCHKEQACGICKETKFGFVGMKHHTIMAHNGTVPPKAQPANLASVFAEKERNSPGSPMQQRELVGTPRQSVSSSSPAQPSARASPAQPSFSFVTQPAPPEANAIGVELPDSPDEIMINDDQNGSAASTSTRSTNGEAAQRTTTLTQSKKSQGQQRQRKDSTSSSSSSSSDGGKKKKTTALPAATKSTQPKYAPAQKKTSGNQAPKRPRVQDKPATSDSSSSSDSEDEQPQIAQWMPKPAMPRQRMTTSQERNSSSDDTSSTSSSEDDETAPKKPQDRLKISSVFSVKDIEKRKAVSNVLKIPQPRPNIFSAAASGPKESTSSTPRSASAKRKSMETHNAANMEYVCTLCNQASAWQSSVLRHVETIHRIRIDMCPNFCQSREIPKMAYDEEEEEDQGDQRSNMHSTGVQVKKICPECKLWSKKVQSLEKILAKVAKQIGNSKKQLEEEQNE